MATLIHRSRDPRRGAIWQGSADDVVRENARFDLIVLCAEEFQPQASIAALPTTKVVHTPNDDSDKPLNRTQLDDAIRATRAVAYLKGRTILISCMTGRNHSGSLEQASEAASCFDMVRRLHSQAALGSRST